MGFVQDTIIVLYVLFSNSGVQGVNVLNPNPYKALGYQVRAMEGIDAPDTKKRTRIGGAIQRRHRLPLEVTLLPRAVFGQCSRPGGLMGDGWRGPGCW